MLLPLSRHKKILFSENRGVFKVSSLGEAVADGALHGKGTEKDINYNDIIKDNLESFRGFIKKLLKAFECDDCNYTKHVAISALRSQTTERIIATQNDRLKEEINEVKAKVA